MLGKCFGGQSVWVSKIYANQKFWVKHRIGPQRFQHWLILTFTFFYGELSLQTFEKMSNQISGFLTPKIVYVSHAAVLNVTQLRT
ncbi:hypothetical protein EUGRSUZ_B03853 [Eucalyptus grandis]|uniref:Uncharacterized protein n=2 Tax=Eucalyptus grandis TaxID=71139 RepID=A0ACC3LY08_EUCGR|nr:hypothetical protein EUGRSUZ_B03853 [Eucalyptus grandis]